MQRKADRKGEIESEKVPFYRCVTGYLITVHINYLYLCMNVHFAVRAIFVIFSCQTVFCLG